MLAESEDTLSAEEAKIRDFEGAGRLEGAFVLMELMGWIFRELS